MIAVAHEYEGVRTIDHAANAKDYKNQVIDIINKHVDEELIQRKVKTKGWLNKMWERVMGTNFPLHTIQIRLGKKFEPILREIASLTHSVPQFIAGHKVSQDEAKKFIAENQGVLKNGDIPILTRLNVGDLEIRATEYWESFKKLRKKDKNRRLTVKELDDFSEYLLKSVPTQDKIEVLRIDFAMSDEDYVLAELRSSGYTDARKSYDTLKHLLTCFVALGHQKKRLYLGVVTNSTGNRKTGEWKGHLGGHVEKGVILVEDDLWNILSPPNLPFEEFQAMVENRFKSLIPKK